MPAFRRNNPSVAPVSMIGTIGTGPQIALTDASMAANTSGLSGDAGLGTAVSIGVRCTDESLIARVSARSTAAGSSPGSIRQLTVAFAVWGSALGACPPSSIVATHVVRTRALYRGVWLRRESVAASAVPLATLRMSAAITGRAVDAAFEKYAFTTSFGFAGNSYAATRSSAFASA